MQCRACLKTLSLNYKNITLLDELNIMYYNKITDLNISLGDRMPQQLCQKCAKVLKNCYEFREKCIASNSILMSAPTLVHELSTIIHIKQEQGVENEKKYLTDVHNKQEIELKDEFIDSEYNELPENNIDYDYVPGSKPTNIAESTHKSIKEMTRKKSLRAKPKKVNSNSNGSLIRKYDCGLCMEKVEKDKLCNHVKSHEKSNSCGICPVYFQDSESLLQHRISHLKKANFICHICLHILQNSESLEFHYDIKHFSKNKDRVKCIQCDRSFTTVKNFRKHWKSLHSGQKFKCKVCSEEFPTANTRNYHIHKHHKLKKKIFCDNCNYSTEIRANLVRHHLRVHTAAAEKVFCKLCKAQFVNESGLKLHQCQYSTHSICPICGVVFEVPVKLKEHLATHSDERKYKCDRCDVAYKSRGALRIHTNKHDGIRPHKCEYCPAAFWAPSTLIKHRRTHTGEKPYVCEVCNKGFTGNHNLKLHMRVHGVYNLIKKKGTEEVSMENVQECNKGSHVHY
ncbi:zinc finger protein 287-like [Aricia agestis]|uniref:zinc finger protein 287-like n=1 Tax=Aricia agestis TaxID=91739 RepID=UPI001C201854|nr:zinc finger protein 287-like [Aricia agestis]